MLTCVKYRNISITAGLLALLLGGCAAKQTTTSQSVTSDEPQETSTAARVTPPVSEVIDLFTQHPHTVFQLTTQSYSMYVGGELTAQLDAQKELFNIVADDNTVTCQYTKAGNLQAPSDEATKKEIKNHEKTCETLVNTLYSALN
ncbi:hypothetical protein MNBD_GAMMA16-398 [hydrothermal vent metagenome]|uniref:Lipoprotein n=1 Tax=hydrothermal vent metagenome TaxID=652676 RepID=A0A3B0ZAG6_9ZZZZ